MIEKAAKNPANEYVVRVNRAIDYILQHLDQPLTLEVIAEVAGFSQFHFHRIFRTLVGETLNAFIKRLRLERALGMMSRDERRSLTEIALACGFSSSSDFSRAFRKHFDVAPSGIDLAEFRAQRRETWRAAVTDPEHRHLLDGLAPGQNPDDFAVRLRALPARRVAYIRVHDAYRPHVVPAAAERLLAWADRQGYADNQWLGYTWDDPEIVPHNQCRYDVAVEIPNAQLLPDVDGNGGEISSASFPELLVAEIEIRGPIDLEVRALDWLYRTWLPQSDYQPTAQPSFEAWHGRPFAHGMEHFELTIQLPLEPLRRRP